MKSGLPISDLITGLYATCAILGAVAHRSESGRGQHIDMALLDCTAAVTSYQALNFFLSGQIPRALGNAHPNMAPYQLFSCREGQIIIAVGNDSQFRARCDVIGRPDLIADERFKTVPLRNRHRDALIPMVQEALLTKTQRAWIELLDPRGVCGRCKISPRCLSIRRCSIAACCNTSRIPLARARRQSPARSAIRRRRWRMTRRRRCWGSTPTRFCPNACALTRRASTISAATR